MSINTAHTSNGVLFHTSEFLLLFTDCVVMELQGEDIVPFYGLKFGRLFLTSHRMIYLSKKPDAWLQSASFPYVALSEIGLGSTTFFEDLYVEGVAQPQSGGHFHNEITFKLQFGEGGEEIFAEVLLWCIESAKTNAAEQDITEIPPYEPQSGWFELKPEDYEAPDLVKEIIPVHPSFYQPQPNTIYATGDFAPYVGILDLGYRPPEPRPCYIEPPICCGRRVLPKKSDLYKKVCHKKVFKPGCAHLLPVCHPIEKKKPNVKNFAQQFDVSYYRLLAGVDPKDFETRYVEKTAVETNFIDKKDDGCVLIDDCPHLFERLEKRREHKLSQADEIMMRERESDSLYDMKIERSVALTSSEIRSVFKDDFDDDVKDRNQYYI